MKSIFLCILALGALNSFAQVIAGSTVTADLKIECFNEDNFSKSITAYKLIVTPKGLFPVDRDGNEGNRIDFSTLKGCAIVSETLSFSGRIRNRD